MGALSTIPGRRVRLDPGHVTLRVLLGLLLAAGHASAQHQGISFYYQNVGVGVAANQGRSAGVLDAQRARLMWTPVFGGISLDVAYEHTFEWRDTTTTSAGDGLVANSGASGDWLQLGGSVHESRHMNWHHRFDRLSISATHGSLTATVGRQAVSWATTLFLTPADPFVPFDPADPFREYRTGIDAARVQWFSGPFTVVDLVVRPADTPVGHTLTALLRGKTGRGPWELTAWGGVIHDAAGGALGVTRTVAGSAVRAESEFRRDSTGHAIARIAAGIDRRVTLFGRDLYAVVEYQHDPFGARRAVDLGAVATSPAASRLELQVLGRDEAAMQATYQVHPLVSAELLTMWNLRDGSALLSPATTISLSNSISARLGVFVTSGLGTGVAGPGSEYGPVPTTAYLALSAFF